MSIPPDFDLAPLRSVAPERIISATDDALGRLILFLSATYNDLKDSQYALIQLGASANANRKTGDPPDAVVGQLVGMFEHAGRLQIGIIREFLDELHDIQVETKVLDSDEFRRLVLRVPTPYQAKWRSLRALAAGAREPSGKGTSERKFWLVLERIRHNVSFHYSSKLIASAFTAFFANPSDPAHGRAYFSDGKNMEGTRFYFADAAMQRAAQREMDGWIQEVNTVSRQMNDALKSIICAFLAQRST